MMKTKNTLLGIAATGLVATIGYFTIGDPKVAEAADDTIDDSIVVDSPKTCPAISETAGSFLVFSDTHLHHEKDQYSMWFDSQGKPYKRQINDTGYDLWATTTAHLDSMMKGLTGLPKPKFVLLLGDLPWHAYPGFNSTSPDLISARQNTGRVLAEVRAMASNNNVPLIYAPGNNDSYDGDYHEFTTSNGKDPFDQDTNHDTDWPMIGSSPCGGSTPCIANDSIRKLGAFSAYPLGVDGKLRVISINSVMFHKSDHSTFHYTNDTTYLNEQQNDINTQLNWLTEQLDDVCAKGERALLMMHIPPGIDGHSKSPMWESTFTYPSATTGDPIPIQNYFLDLMNTYQHSVVGLLSSHTHLDGVRKLENRNGDFTELLVSIPGIPTANGNNSGIKMIAYNAAYELTDFTVNYNAYKKYKSNGEPNFKVNNWGINHHYNFKDQFQYTGNASMYEHIKDSVSDADLVNYVSSFYKVMNGYGNPSDVKVTLNVAYQKTSHQ